ncbi:unnamed protein product [Spirodela intermedia]|uniref:Uncharacterized protein n=1 Tax=Spirodela intermedia TaxID=51605 RepID=A0A7I8J9C0_SPIIN|nr:unnamed protein product [Spirodela intermedia]CAA6666694.1 unnamed protein product [Spirodela intermedia]
MATTVSAWGKPGAWALESEEQEAMEPSADFPSLAAAASTKIPKKKKGQTISLASSIMAFQVRSLASSGSPLVPSKGLTHDERLMLPTAPRERTAEELELGNSRGFNSYGGGRSRMNGEDSVSRWDSSRVSDEDLAPSRADEIDDWGANKRSVAPPAERRERTGGFFESQSRVDDLDSWVSNKSAPPPLPDSRRMGDGFRERRGFDMFNRDAPAPNGGGDPDSESWGGKERMQVERGLDSGCSANSASNEWRGEQFRVLKAMRLKGFGLGGGPGSQPDDKTERTWRKTDPVESATSEPRKASSSREKEGTTSQLLQTKFFLLYHLPCNA